MHCTFFQYFEVVNVVILVVVLGVAVAELGVSAVVSTGASIPEVIVVVDS